MTSKHPQAFTLTLMTSDIPLAIAADKAGIDRIGIDIERLGKSERQGHLNTWISHHKEGDLIELKDQLRSASLFARCNPIHAESCAEIDRLLNLGVTTLMLPYFKSTKEAETFIRLVDGRAHPVLLLETKEAATQVKEICSIPGVLEIHIGLNDMRLSLGWPGHFHVLASTWIEPLCAHILQAGHRLGIGGLARVGDLTLPVPTDLVAARIVGLGAQASLISRAFYRDIEASEMSTAISSLRNLLSSTATQAPSWHAEVKAQLNQKAERFSPQ